MKEQVGFIDNKEKDLPKYMFPTNDFIFKKIFGAEGNEDVTKDLVSSIIGQKIKKLEFKNPDLLRDYKEDKNEVLDVKAVLNDDVLCDIEVQVADNHDIDKRSLDYWSKMYRTSIHKGDSTYLNMKKTIVILITAFEIEDLKEIKDFQTRFKIIEEKHQKILTDVFEIDIIELPKAIRDIKNGTFNSYGNLEKWIEFFIDPFGRSISEMKEMSDELKKAYEELQKLNADEVEREIAERRYLNLLSIEYGKEYERKAGIEEGIQQEKLEIAKKMKISNKPIEEIIEFTGLTKEEIEKL